MEEPSARRIVNVDDVRPRSSRGKRTKTIVGFLAMAVVVVAVAVVFGNAGGGKAKAIKGYAVAAVERADFVKSVEASGTVVVPAEISVPSPQEGYASWLYVKEGDTVKKGQVLTALSVPDLLDDRRDYAAQLAVAKVGLKSVENDYDYQIATKRVEIRRLDVEIADAQKDVDAKKALLALKSSRQSDYETAVKTLKGYVEDKEDAESALDNLIKTREIAIEKQQATIDQLEIELARTDADIEEARVKSPLAGEVLSIADELSVPGSLISQGDALMTIADRTGTYIDFDVGEQYISSLKEGDTVATTVGAKTLIATITSIGRTASLASDGLTATVAVRAKPEEGASLTPGASAVATINLGTKKDDLVLPRGAYLTTGSQKYVYKVEDGVARKVAVEFGEIQGNQVEVVKGLEAGDRIITSGYTDFIDESVVELK